jgi:hypothetical protein
MFGSANNKSVKINSNVDNASVYVDGRYYGAMQSGVMMVALDGGVNHAVTIEKTGYRSVTMPVNREVQGAFYFNIPLLFFFVVPGILGFVVDGATGNMYAYEPVYISLQK